MCHQSQKNVFFNARWNVLSNRFLPLSTLEDLIDRHESGGMVANFKTTL
jgi:hypothetical protein